MVNSSPDDRFVGLRGGLIIAVDACTLLPDLEARGFRAIGDREKVLIVQPANRLTNADRVHIRRWKWHPWP